MSAPQKRTPTRRVSQRKGNSINARTAARIERERRLTAQSCDAVASVPADRKLIPLQSAADRLGISIWTLRSWVYAGKVAYHRLGTKLLIASDEIDRIIAESACITAA